MSSVFQQEYMCKPFVVLNHISRRWRRRALQSPPRVTQDCRRTESRRVVSEPPGVSRCPGRCVAEVNKPHDNCCGMLLGETIAARSGYPCFARSSPSVLEGHLRLQCRGSALARTFMRLALALAEACQA
jgi:hypothetical protein